jgi:hypothetical protein
LKRALCLHLRNLRFHVFVCSASYLGALGGSAVNGRLVAGDGRF